MDYDTDGAAANPSYNCTDIRDAFSAENTSAKLDYPISLMTTDEIAFAGGLAFKTDMEKNLNNNYCGKRVNDTCYYTRTYRIINIAETTDSNFVDVTLTTHNGNKKVVRINNAFDIKAGKNYEFVFSTYEKIEDDINNIFKKSTLVEVKETNNIINQEICVN